MNGRTLSKDIMTNSAHTLHFGKERSQNVKLELNSKFPRGCSIFSLEDLETVMRSGRNPKLQVLTVFRAVLTPPTLGSQQGGRCYPRAPVKVVLQRPFKVV